MCKIVPQIRLILIKTTILHSLLLISFLFSPGSLLIKSKVVSAHFSYVTPTTAFLSSSLTPPSTAYPTTYLLRRYKQYSTTATTTTNNSIIPFPVVSSRLLVPRTSSILQNQIIHDDEGWDGDKSLVSSGSSSTVESDTNHNKTLSSAGDDNTETIDKIIIKKEKGATETDLFIPIFAIISIIGFAGLYLYETLRLYSKGELYLPWNS
jgi:hypothetical protein